MMGTEIGSCACKTWPMATFLQLVFLVLQALGKHVQRLAKHALDARKTRLRCWRNTLQMLGNHAPGARETHLIDLRESRFRH